MFTSFLFAGHTVQAGSPGAMGSTTALWQCPRGRVHNDAIA